MRIHFTYGIPSVSYVLTPPFNSSSASNFVSTTLSMFALGLRFDVLIKNTSDNAPPPPTSFLAARVHRPPSSPRTVSRSTKTTSPLCSRWSPRRLRTPSPTHPPTKPPTHPPTPHQMFRRMRPLHPLFPTTTSNIILLQRRMIHLDATSIAAGWT